MRDYGDEEVLCISTSIIPKTVDDLIRLPTHWIPRGQAEELGCGYLQLIPYVVVINKDDQIFTYQRLSAGSEKRLVGKTSIGIGGHINPIDAFMAPNMGTLSTLYSASKREIGEELNINFKHLSPLLDGLSYHLFDPTGANSLIYDTSTEVSRLHIGVPMILEASEVSVKETDKIKGEFMNPEDIDVASCETWSQIILKRIRKDGI